MSKAKRHEDDRLRREICGIGLITLGILILVSLLVGPAGAFPTTVVTFLKSVVGAGAYLVSLVLIGLGIVLLAQLGNVRARRTVLGALVLFLVFLTVIHLQSEPGSEFDPDTRVTMGGLIGAALAAALRRTFGEPGLFVILGGAIAGAIIVMSDVSGREVLLALGNSFVHTGHAIATVIGARRRRRKPNKADVIKRRRKESISTAQEAVQEPAALSRPTEPSPSPSAHAPDLPTEENEPQPAAQGSQYMLFDKQSVYQLPSLDLLQFEPESEQGPSPQEMTDNIVLLEDTLESFGVTAKVTNYQCGPVITRYEVEPARGIRVSRIANLADDLALALATIDVRVEAPIPGKSAVGIEVPNRNSALVTLRSVLDSPAMRKNQSLLAFALGKDIAGEPVVADLARMPHLLIAGATNSGKSVCLNSIICSILFRAKPNDVRFVMIDPKRVELPAYDDIPHLLAPVVQTAREAQHVLRWAIKEMERRYDRFAIHGVRNITEYNADVGDEKRLPYIVIVIDELADLMMQSPSEFEFSICRLAQLARATGIHLVVATQRPSKDVVTGTIKANIPSRIAFAVASQVDSRIILDCNGAERLIGRGDMLYLPIDGTKPRRIQGCYVDRRETEALAEFIREQQEPEYVVPPLPPEAEEKGELQEEFDDELLQEAIKLVRSHNEASVSMLQRRFKIGYARAGRLIDAMERMKIVGPYEGSKARRVLPAPEAADPDDEFEQAETASGYMEEG